MSESWIEELEAFLRPGSVLVGIGNLWRGDDAFGPLLIRRLSGRVPWGLWDAGETPESDIGRVAAYEPARVLLLDATRSNVTAGRVGFFRTGSIPRQGVSTHAVSLRVFAELLAGRAGCQVALLGVEPRNTGFSAPLSLEVQRSLDRVAEVLVEMGGREQAESAGGTHAGLHGQ